MARKSLAQRVINALSDDLRRLEYRGNPNPLAGHCYITAEVLYHLEARSKGYRPRFIRWEGSPHWFLAKGVSVIDLTVSQFRAKPNYKLAKGIGFLTKQPSKRAMVVINRVLGIDSGKERE